MRQRLKSALSQYRNDIILACGGGGINASGSAILRQLMVTTRSAIILPSAPRDARVKWKLAGEKMRLAEVSSGEIPAEAYEARKCVVARAQR